LLIAGFVLSQEAAIVAAIVFDAEVSSGRIPVLKPDG
jgi:hypothetical protein